MQAESAKSHNQHNQQNEIPKVKVQKVQKEGWMNIYPSTEYSTFPCENSAVYRTKEIADDCASSNRIDCVKVQWEVEE